jgi:hypothetical protein
VQAKEYLALGWRPRFAESLPRLKGYSTKEECLVSGFRRENTTSVMLPRELILIFRATSSKECKI